MPLDTKDKVAHLLRRAGFAARPEEIEQGVAKGLPALVDDLVNFEKFPDNLGPLPNAPAQNGIPPNTSYLDLTTQQYFSVYGSLLNDMQRLWLNAMITTTRPLQEKMVLFWHGLFATSGADLDLRHMYLQNEHFRGNFDPNTGRLGRLAATHPFPVGNFRNILENLSKDIAMLFYLDNFLNVKLNADVGSNENYARELLELFSLGVNDPITGEPNYTEVDVRQASRALTGWTVLFERDDRLIRQFFFNSSAHDFGPYRVLNRSFSGDGRQLFDIIVNHRNPGQQQSACGRFLGYRLFKFFGYDDPEPEVINDLADTFDGVHGGDRYNIRAMLRRIFTPGNPTSEAFYSDKAFKAHIKSPTEYIVSTFRLLRPTGLANSQLVTQVVLGLRTFSGMIQMGQYLFFPPNVAGWKEGLDWINTSFNLARCNFANTMATLVQPAQGGIDVHSLLQANGLLTNGQLAPAERVVDFFTTLLLQAPVSAQTRQTLINYMNAPGGSTDMINMKVRGLLHLIMTMPEFQLS
ncbi:MAG: DUF1800 domain-containing protein [Acidobacteriota bacterium]|nr:DUF1800 domain-containing protein [Blastocatellia bacterium]MDW8240019.1 DUF1800 domain-containing protein [Acidobacteriota bacterium]